MAAKVTSTKTQAKKTTGKKAPAALTPARSSKLPPISSRAKEAAEEAAKPEKEKPAPPKPVETLSLIEPKKKAVKRAPGTTTAKKLPSIGRVEPEPEVKPVEVTSEPVSEASDSTESVAEVIEEGGKKIIHIKPPIIVKELAVHMNLKPYQLIKDLMTLNVFVSINQQIEPDVASKLCELHGFIFEKEKRKTGEGVHKAEPVVAPPPPQAAKKEEELQNRAPIITFMGHVDHGKTSLMDAIRKSRVAVGEAGGITQHIGAYSVIHNGKPITFIDTPGHAAFTAMRARGANVTDIVVIVVAADDGLMPQTIEAINHAKAAKVTIMVAINKVDLASANIDRVKKQLQEIGLQPEDWGGETICIPVSATKGTGLDQLLEMMHLQSEILELKASSTTTARATVIETQLEPGRGPTATVIVKMGTLKVGQAFICGNIHGKVKTLIGDDGKPVKEATPATPVKVLGFSGLANAGDELVEVESERTARTLGEERQTTLRTEKLSTPQRVTLENLFQNLAEDQRKSLKVILKSDVQGSLEALLTALNDIESRKIDLNILHNAVGPISESDVLLASASDAIIVGFNVKTESTAATAARREGVQIKLYSIIYELIDQMKEAMTGLLDAELRETIVGHAEVKQVFELSRGKVAGCMVIDGRIIRTGRARILRRKQPIFDGGLSTLRRFTDDVKEVRNGLECGIKLGDFSEYEVGDIIECYQLDKFAQQL
ncbi:MAG: translation initiation factor IF-2 [Chthoniobacterales bacterium]